jgi:hypothetical protein
MIAAKEVNEMVGRQVSLPLLNGFPEVDFNTTMAIRSPASEEHLLPALVEAQHGPHCHDLTLARVNLPARGEEGLQLGDAPAARHLILFVAADVMTHRKAFAAGSTSAASAAIFS